MVFPLDLEGAGLVEVSLSDQAEANTASPEAHGAAPVEVKAAARRRPPPPGLSLHPVAEAGSNNPPISPRNQRPVMPKMSPREMMSPLVTMCHETPLFDCAAYVGDEPLAPFTGPADTIAGRRRQRVLEDLRCGTRQELLQRTNLTLFSEPPVKSRQFTMVNLASDDLVKTLERTPLLSVVHGSGATTVEEAAYAAIIGRRNLIAALQRFVELRDLTEQEAMEAALDILFKNCQR